MLVFLSNKPDLKVMFKLSPVIREASSELLILTRNPDNGVVTMIFMSYRKRNLFTLNFVVQLCYRFIESTCP